MNAGLEFHDSDVSAIEQDGSTIRILFDPAYVHRSAGRPGVDAGEVYTQRAEMVFGAAVCAGYSVDCVRWLSDGWLSVDGASYDNVVPVRSRPVGGLKRG